MRSSFPYDSVPKNRYLSYHTIAHLANDVPPRSPPAGGIPDAVYKTHSLPVAVAATLKKGGSGRWV